MKEMILEEANRYASQNNNIFFQLIMSDLNTFNEILMLTGYHSLPRTRMCWEKEEDAGASIVYEALKRTEFEAIKKYLHFANNGNLNQHNWYPQKCSIQNVQDGQSWVKYQFFPVYPNSCDTLFESSENLETDACHQYLSKQKILEGRMCSSRKLKNWRTALHWKNVTKKM